MLTHLEISDFALIERISLPLSKGLTVLTGETGAGKSILIDAIGCLLGERTSRDLVRHQAKEARIDAVFESCRDLNGDASDPEVGVESGVEDNQEWLITRTISATGKSLCRMNGHIVTLSELKNLTGLMVDIHGQHEQQSIFEETTQRRLLDSYAGVEVEQLKTKWREKLAQFRKLKQELKDLAIDPSERERQLDLLSYEIEEISGFDWQTGVFEKLEKRVKQLEALLRIQDDLAEALAVLDTTDTESGFSQIQSIESCLEYPAQHSQRLSRAQESLGLALEQLNEVRNEIYRVVERIETNQHDLEKMRKELDLRNRQLRKYGGTSEAVLTYLHKAQKRQLHLELSEERVKEIEAELMTATMSLEVIGHNLWQKRDEAAKRLSKAIEVELGDLDMKNVALNIDVTHLGGSNSNYSEDGHDEIVWLIAPNLGEPLKPLSRIASGGEAARILLAVKSVLAEVDNLDTLIFDEIDTGISGITASKAALKLRRLGEQRQVLCITHSAQIAAAAHNHLKITKQEHNGRTKTTVETLDRALREHEVARLLTGKSEDKQTLALAAKMIDNIDELNIKGD